MTCQFLSPNKTVAIILLIIGILILLGSFGFMIYSIGYGQGFIDTFSWCEELICQNVISCVP